MAPPVWAARSTVTGRVTAFVHVEVPRNHAYGPTISQSPSAIDGQVSRSSACMGRLADGLVGADQPVAGS